MITFDTVSKRYPDGTTAVSDLSLDIPAGRITVLVGPSGCGKTTSLRMINRMIQPTSGRVLIDGQDIADMDPSRLRRGIGYVIQHAGLFPHRTVLDNVATVPRLLGADRRAARSQAAATLERVGLDTALGSRYPAQLSGGQQQRVGVARALAADPPIMLMDEPFSAVDPVVRAQLQAEFARLQSELGKTIVFVTHDIDEAVRLGDQVAVLDVGGVLAQVDPPHRLLDQPANAMVADFVGRDRGFRALDFRQAQVETTREAVAQLGRPLPPELTSRQWVAVVDEEERPVGWVEPGRLTGPVTRQTLHRPATTAPAQGSLRRLLDAALSSPCGRGLTVDADGRFTGTVTTAHVLECLERSRPGPPTAAERGLDDSGDSDRADSNRADSNRAHSDRAHSDRADSDSRDGAGDASSGAGGGSRP